VRLCGTRTKVRPPPKHRDHQKIYETPNGRIVSAILLTVSRTDDEMKKDEMGAGDARDHESGIKAGERGADQQTGQQKTRIVITTGTESEEAGETVIEKEAVIIGAVEGSAREVEVRTDIDLRKVGLSRQRNMEIILTNLAVYRNTSRQRSRSRPTSPSITVPLSCSEWHKHIHSNTIASKSSTI
jgi:hypothetical protein